MRVVQPLDIEQRIATASTPRLPPTSRSTARHGVRRQRLPYSFTLIEVCGAVAQLQPQQDGSVLQSQHEGDSPKTFASDGVMA